MATSSNATIIEDRLVELINLASIGTDVGKKVEYLYQIKELALNYGLLDKYFDGILAFQNERTPNVKKFIPAFIEDACKHDVKLCPKAILSLYLLLTDSNNDVLKRAVQAATQFYKALVQWIVNSLSFTDQKLQVSSTNDPRNSASDMSPIVATTLAQSKQHQQSPSQGQPAQIVVNDELSGDIEKTWLMWLQICNLICSLLETTNNDGVRTHCIKFIETMVLMQTPSDKHTDSIFEQNLIDHKMTSIKLSDEAALCKVPDLPKNGVIFNEEHKLELVETAKKRFEQLVIFHGTSHISSVNLMATMQSLVILAKQRYRLFMGRVIQAMESLNSRLPPTLTESQVQSVKKFLKTQLLVMIKHPYSIERYQPQITQLLQAVGSKQPEIHRIITEYKNKYGIEAPTLNSNLVTDSQKRIKLEAGAKTDIKPLGSQSIQTGPVGKGKHLDLNKLTQELDEKEKRQIVVDSVRRILGDEKNTYIPPAQMEIKKKVLSTLANEFSNTDCPKIIQDYIFSDLKNRHEISYAVIRKNYDVAAAQAKKRNINLLEDDDMLKSFWDCLYEYMQRAMQLKDEEKEVILPKLYALRDEFYSITNQGQEIEDQ